MIWPSCKEVSAAAAAGEHERASLPARWRWLAHLAVCSSCRRFKRQLALIARALRESVFEVPDARRTEALERAVLARLSPPQS
jgi:hypothetical protein